jgi:hypothetical protein
MSELPEELDHAHHSIAIGQGAFTTQPYQIALHVVLEPGHPPARLTTIMTPQEWEVVYEVMVRLCQEGQQHQRHLESN